MTPVDVLAALFALPVAVFLVIVVHAIIRWRRSPRQPANRERSDVKDETRNLTKPKVQ